MKRIGEEAGVAPNTLYARFPDKAALFKAIIEWKAALWKVTNPARFAPRGAPLYEVLRVAITEMLQAMEREDISALGRLLALEAGRFPELGLIYHQVVTATGHSGLPASIVASGDCDLSAEEAEEIAQTTIECVVGHMKLRVFHGSDSESHRKTADRISRVLTRPIGRRPAH
jgi:AcrR family transcriptional regulator